MSKAQSEMSTIMVRLDKLHSVQMFPERGWGALIKHFMDYAVGRVRPLMWLLLGAVSFVLLIACGNAANLLLARAANRMRELGMRVGSGCRPQPHHPPASHRIAPDRRLPRESSALASPTSSCASCHFSIRAIFRASMRHRWTCG